MDVLWWLENHSRALKSFVGNRVAKIQRKPSPMQWAYIESKNNPADMLTRGLTVTEMINSKLWWMGPDFLVLPESSWPKTDVMKSLEATHEISRNKSNKERWATENMYFFEVITDSIWRLEPKRFSRWMHLKIIYAWVRRFLHNCQITDAKLGGELSPDELADVEKHIIMKQRQQSFLNEYKALKSKNNLTAQSKLLALNPFLDKDGLIRANSRLKYADYLRYDVRFPIILPRGEWVTKLIVRSHYEAECHAAGTNHTLADVSERYWIMQAREEIRQVENECGMCKRRKAKTVRQLMAPRIRLSFRLHASARTAVDFGGPFITIQGRGRKRLKRYLCLFTCLASRAVHLEIAFSLDTDSFLNVFYHMVNRRGLPTEVTSDNGTNFVGGERELRELVEALDTNKITRSGADRGIKWYFNPPLAPHFGGAHETMIKAAKRSVYNVLGNADINHEELITAFTGAESLINSRPLTYQTANPKDDVPLTPNHFLHGQVIFFCCVDS